MELKRKQIRQSLQFYWRKKLYEGITHLAMGGGISYLLLHTLHFIEFFRHNGILQIIIFILVGLMPLTLNFIHFHQNRPLFYGLLFQLEGLLNNISKNQQDALLSIAGQKLAAEIAFLEKVSPRPLTEFEARNYVHFHERMHNMQTMLFDAFANKNQLMVDMILSTLNKEQHVISEIKDNQLERRVFHHSDYLREVLTRTLREVMKNGDHYVTLSTLDCWIVQPFDPEDFLKVNFEAAFDSSKLIDRILVVDKKFLTGEGLSSGDVIRFNQFVQFITKIKEMRSDLQYNYKEKIKLFFHFPGNYAAIREYLDSIIIINSRLDEVMFIKVQGLSCTTQDFNSQHLEGPQIQTHFFKLDAPLTTTISAYDIIQILKHIKASVESKIENGIELRRQNQKEYERLLELNRYLKEYKKFFGKVYTIYDTNDDGETKHINAVDCDFYDVEMLYQHFGRLKQQKPHLFIEQN